MNLFHSETSLKFCCCIHQALIFATHLQPAISTSSLLWSQWSPKCCLCGQNKWESAQGKSGLHNGWYRCSQENGCKNSCPKCTMCGCSVMLKNQIMQQIICLGHCLPLWCSGGFTLLACCAALNGSYQHFGRAYWSQLHRQSLSIENRTNRLSWNTSN